MEPHRHKCIVSLSKTHFPLLSTCSTPKDPSLHNCKIVDWDVKNKINILAVQHNQKQFIYKLILLFVKKSLLRMATISLKLHTRLVVFAGFPLISEKKVILNTNEITKS